MSWQRSTANDGAMPPHIFIPFAAIAFVVLWSTGFVGAKYADPYAEPLTTLAIRFAAAAGLFMVWSILARAPWPGWRSAAWAVAIGAGLHGVYLGGVFVAVDRGLPAGPAALIVSVQPVLTALFAIATAQDRCNLVRWTGIALGFLGVVLVTWPKLDGPDAWPIEGIAFCVGALVAITVASAMQKQVSGTTDLRTGGTYQYIGGLLVVLPGALLFEDRIIDWTPQLAFALTWMVVVLSLGAVSLYMALLARGSLVATVSLMYLVPAVTAVMAFIMFDERLAPLQLSGMLLSATGVAIVTRDQRAGVLRQTD